MSGLLEDEQYPLALKLARGGATRGMIVQRLTRQQLSKERAQFVADRALNAVVRRRRAIGLMQVLGGCGLFVGGVLAWLTLGLVQVSIVAMMFGFFFAGLGLCNSFHLVKKRTPSA